VADALVPELSLILTNHLDDGQCRFGERLAIFRVRSQTATHFAGVAFFVFTLFFIGGFIFINVTPKLPRRVGRKKERRKARLFRWKRAFWFFKV
jgi:hypothetical protein